MTDDHLEIEDADYDDDDEVERWTPAGAARLRSAAGDVAEAIMSHAEALARLAPRGELEDVFAAGDALLPVILAYADAQNDYTGRGFPLGVLHEFAEDDDDGDDGTPPAGVSVVQRHDYAVTDEAAVLSAGRAAYLRVWPDDDEATAARRVGHLGNALYELAHADGWDSLEDAPGLVPTGGRVVVFKQDQVLGGDSDDWPDELFVIDGEPLFTQDDIYPT